MGELQGINKILGQSPATDPPARSRTVTERVQATCPTCQQPFQTWRDGERCGPTTCQSCRNQEQQRVWIAQRREELPRYDELRRELWRENCNIPLKFCISDFQSFKREMQPKAYECVESYVAKAHSAILASPDVYGVGKTHLVCALGNQLLASCPAITMLDDGRYRNETAPVYFTTEAQLLARIRATFEHREGGESEAEAYSRIQETHLLIIDDVGKVRPRDPSFLQSVYFRLVDDVYADGDPDGNWTTHIILTTNLSLAQLESHIGGAASDRLREMCGKDNIVVMKGTSYRK